MRARHIPRLQIRPSAISPDIAIWRKPGRIQGGAACATCHSPDGIELAVYRFEDADILRRAKQHLSDDDSQQVVDYIHGLRTKLNVTDLRDPDLDRPLQPGGSILPGKTPAERDLAFGLELRDLLPHLFKGRIETLGQAKIAEAELLKVQPVNLKAGIPFNRLSEDVAHGSEHASIAQWLPEVPPAVPQDQLSEWYAAEDRYLADPNEERLHDLIFLHLQLVNKNRMLALGVISTAKYRALLVWQDRIRHRTERDPLNVASDVARNGNYNPIWEVGEEARQAMGRDPHGLGMDEETQGKKLAGTPLAEQLSQLRVAWFWAGWLSDQGLFKTSHDDKTRLGMWFSESLSKDGPYPIHNVFANARRQAVVSNDPVAWGEPLARKRRIWDFAGLRSFGFEFRDVPADPEYRNLYIGFTANCFRMNLLLLKEAIERTHEVWGKLNTKSNIAALVDFIKRFDPPSADAATKLQRELTALVDAAKQRG